MRSTTSSARSSRRPQHVTVAALAGDAAAGGVPFALAADHVVAREDVVLNPYYGHMGGLYGSEYWTYLLPRRVGAEMTAELTAPPFEAVGTRRAVEIGLLDDAFGDTVEQFRARVRTFAERLAPAPGCPTARREAGGAPPRRAHQAAHRLPHGGARPLVQVLLRRGPQLPRGAPPVRPQARRAVRRRAAAGPRAPRELSRRAPTR